LQIFSQNPIATNIIDVSAIKSQLFGKVDSVQDLLSVA